VTGRSRVTELAEEALRRGRRAPFPWWHRLELGKGGKPKATLHNVVVVLTEHEAWRELYRLDEFANVVRLTREPPYGGAARELSDRDGAELAVWLGDTAIGMPAGSKLAAEGIEVVAARAHYHPVRLYLEGLVWDGEERLAHLLPDRFGTYTTPYTQTVGVSWLVSAVARVIEPGCKVDFMPVLEGVQGIGKSSGIRALFGADWYAEMTEPPGTKDFYQILAGRWVVEIAEMQSFARAEISKVKQAITTQDDVYRPSYGRVARRYPRQTIFTGSTNEDDYLRDHTGGRRFLPVRCSEVDVAGLQTLRDQLWAEALSRYRAGWPYWQLPAEAGEEQEARYQEDAWMDPIREWVEGRGSPTSYPADVPRGPLAQTTVHEVMLRALEIEMGKQSRQDQMRVGICLRRLGWARERRIGADGARRYVYVRRAPP
jgi:predicted P-loop ATPase